jgi:hypothetical protein
LDGRRSTTKYASSIIGSAVVVDDVDDVVVFVIIVAACRRVGSCHFKIRVQLQRIGSAVCLFVQDEFPASHETHVGIVILGGCEGRSTLPIISIIAVTIIWYSL